MKAQKLHIKQGEALCSHYRDLAFALANAGTAEEYLAALAAVEKSKLDEKIKNIEGRLVSLRKEYLENFERFSVEVNSRMGHVISAAKKYEGKEPSEIINIMISKIGKYESAGFVEQEDKNDLYSYLVETLQVLKKKFR